MSCAFDRSIWALELRQRRRIRGAGKILVDAALKEVLVRCGPGEQGHGRAELHFIDPTKNVARGLGLHVERELRTFPKPRAEDRMGEIGFRLVQRGDREPDRHGALSQTGDLGKDEPHPVALLPPSLQLLANVVVDWLLRVDEAFEIEPVRYLRPLKSPARPRRSAQFRLPAPRAPRVWLEPRPQLQLAEPSPGANTGVFRRPDAPRDDDSVTKPPAQFVFG